MDLDGDGILSMYELEYFYEEQQHRMESIGIETLPFEDCLCQMFDMIKPKRPGCVTLGDLKRCKMTPIFYDTFFNLEKYMEHEQRDPFATQREDDVSSRSYLLRQLVQPFNSLSKKPPKKKPPKKKSLWICTNSSNPIGIDMRRKSMSYW